MVDHRVLGDEVEERRRGVEVAVLAGERGREVEPEAVHAHLGDPVAQRVHDHPQRHGVPDVERVAAAGGVDVAAGRVEVVVGAVVQAAVAQHRAVGARLGGVVEHDVEHHVEPGVVQRGHHRPELRDLAARLPRPHRRRVARVRREEADRVVAPVVGEAAPDEEGLGHALVHRQQLDGGHAEVDAGARPPPGWASPAYVPRSSGGMSGWRIVKPLTCTS